MNIDVMNLEQVIESLAQLDEEVRNAKDIAVVTKATEDKKALLARKTELEELERRKKTALDITTRNIKGEMVDELGNQREERAREFAKTGRTKVSAEETRATLISGGNIATPTAVGGINDPHNTVSSIIDMVYIDDFSGMGGYEEAFVSEWQEAGAGTEGTAANVSDPGFKVAKLQPFDVDVVSYVSKQLRKQSPLKYEEKVRKGALLALKKKIISYIIKGNGSTEPYGIYNAKDTKGNSTCEVYKVTSNKIGAKTLRNIVLKYGGSENVGGNAALMLNKDDLIAFGDVRGKNEEQAVYEIIVDGANPNRGIIKDKGLSVPYVICSDVTALSKSTYVDEDIPTMIYGNPANYKLGLFGDYEVAVSGEYKFAEGMLTVRGESLVGGNVVVEKGFLIVALSNAA